MFGRASLVIAWSVATVGWVVAAPDSRRIAVIDLEGVEIRAGHAMSYASVGQLHKGDKVIVVREEETGFLAIQPPIGTMSWVRKIHLGKIEPNESGKSNVTVMVDGAEVMAGNQKGDAPLNRVTTQLPKGTIVEVMDKPIRIDGSIWYPVVPPEGDLRWIPKNAVRKQEMVAVGNPAPYYPPEPPAYSVAGGETSKAGNEGVVKPAVAGQPKVLTDHKYWAQANRAESSGDYSTAKKLYALIYQDLWDQKVERDALLIAYNRFTRCDEQLKRGTDSGSSRRTESRRETTSDNEERGKPSAQLQAQNPKAIGYLQEMAKVFVDGKQVYAFNDDKGNVVYYATGAEGLNLKTFMGKKVQVFGEISNRAELYRPHIAVEKVETVR